MKVLFTRFSGRFDAQIGGTSRTIVHQSRRRSFLTWADASLEGGTVLPILSCDTSNDVAFAPGFGEAEVLPEDCGSWRSCSLHRGLCSPCGGTGAQCSPGSTPSKVAWVDTCRNPNDGRDYLVS